MLAAVQSGDAKKLAELMGQDPGFNVNGLDEYGWALLHYACDSDSRSPVIPLLLAHPDIDVNLKDQNGWTPFNTACIIGTTSCVRLLLKDSRVMVNECTKDEPPPLWYVAGNGHLDVINWWVASGREMDLGKPEDVYETDAIGVSKKIGFAEVATLLERFKDNPVEARHEMRVELGCFDELAAEVFALVVFVSEMDYCKSGTQLRRRLQPGSSKLQGNYHLNCK